MRLDEKLGLLALHQLDPERAHNLSLRALRLGLVPLLGPCTSQRLKTSIAGLDLPNPIGLAAGFDKNATAIAPLLRAGFGWIELGAATPRPQPGNPKPRLFRLTPERAAINRFGFNNEGAKVIAGRLANRPKAGIVGLNLGANKDSPDRAQDYVDVMKTCGPFVDFVTVNVSSPNTKNLRDLQAAAALNDLLTGVLNARETLNTKPVIFLKIAPDLSDTDLGQIAETALKTGIDGIIATNTTLSRKGLTSPQRHEVGGLSGGPLFTPSTRVLARLAQQIDGVIPLIGVGGITSAEDAYTKIKAGASAVQLYTAMVFQGLGIVHEIANGLDKLLARDGFNSVAEAVGIERHKYT